MGKHIKINYIYALFLSFILVVVCFEDRDKDGRFLWHLKSDPPLPLVMFLTTAIGTSLGISINPNDLPGHKPDDK